MLLLFNLSGDPMLIGKLLAAEISGGVHADPVVRVD